MFAIDEEIKVFEYEFEKVKKTIIGGCDEHLDYLLRVKDALDSLSLRLEMFVHDFEKETNEYPKEEIALLIPRLSDLHKNCYSLVTALKGSSIYKELRSSCDKYDHVVDFLRESIDDSIFFITDDPELDQLLKEINAVLNETSNERDFQELGNNRLRKDCRPAC